MADNDEAFIALIKQYNFGLPLELQLNINDFMGKNIDELYDFADAMPNINLRNALTKLANDKVKKLKQTFETIVTGNPRERFEALCAHIKVGENRRSLVKGLTSTPAVPQLHWRWPRKYGYEWANAFVTGLDAKLMDVVKLFDACGVSDVTFRNKFLVEDSLEPFSYGLHFDTFFVSLWNCDQPEAALQFQFRKYGPVHSWIYDGTSDAFTALKAAFAALMDGAVFDEQGNNNETIDGRSIWPALIMFLEQAHILRVEGNTDAKVLLATALVDKVYMTTYPFYRDEEHERYPLYDFMISSMPERPVFFRASFEDSYADLTLNI